MRVFIPSVGLPLFILNFICQSNEGWFPEPKMGRFSIIYRLSTDCLGQGAAGKKKVMGNQRHSRLGVRVGT
ncbi:MAG: hypothetical protein F6K26_28255 [Moorea sp. SIO2I5]|nr:hypothetical protein [Moorena sp. SIO2I5]